MEQGEEARSKKEMKGPTGIDMIDEIEREIEKSNVQVEEADCEEIVEHIKVEVNFTDVVVTYASSTWFQTDAGATFGDVL